jgi:hypothetical protein
MPYVWTVTAAVAVVCVAASAVILCVMRLRRRPATHAVRTNSPDDYLLRFVQQLRAVEYTYEEPYFAENAQRLAQHIERSLADPQHARFRIECTGNEHKDREIIAIWLDRAAHSAPCLAPSWGRGFSEVLAWALRHEYSIDAESLIRAQYDRLAERHAEFLNYLRSRNTH